MLLPPKFEDLKYGTTLITGLGVSTIIADFDFETYSEAGTIWNEEKNKFVALPYAKEKGLPCVGTAKYSEHLTTEVLCLAYNLKNGEGPKVWKPGDNLPIDLFNHIANNRLLESWNILFEKWIWDNVCVKKYGFPILPMHILRCAMAKARAFNLPGGLSKAATVLNTSHKKDKEGTRLINKFSLPRNPTQKDLRRRVTLCFDETDEDYQDSQALIKYCIQDINTEAEISSKIPDLNNFEYEFWKCDQLINLRGIQIDIVSVDNFIEIIEQAKNKYNHMLSELTGSEIKSAKQVQKLKKLIFEKHAIFIDSLDKSHTEKLLQDETLPDEVKRILQLRNLINSSSVAKLYSIKNQVTEKGRLHNLFNYHGARTGRATASGPQPQNLPNSGPKELFTCLDCNSYFNKISDNCFMDINGSTAHPNLIPTKWGNESIEHVFLLAKHKNLEKLENYYSNALEAISGCLRGLFIAKDDHELIGSDYSSIEAIVLAELAGETWRQEVFKTHGKIYEMSASKITGTPFEEFIQHKEKTGAHHPLRNKLGKIAELASGYGGWINAWKNFGADKILSDDEIKNAILNWRKASPQIVEFWGGQNRGYNKKEFYGLEGNAILAVSYPGEKFTYRNISYLVRGNVLYCELPSGRHIAYHRPKLSASEFKRDTLVLSFETYNTNPKYGAPGSWIRTYTYGGKLTENVVQAVARDILAYAIVNLEKNNMPVVLHVHDEIVSEIPKNTFSIQQFESIMNQMPPWALDWPIKASNGWKALRYNK